MYLVKKYGIHDCLLILRRDQRVKSWAEQNFKIQHRYKYRSPLTVQCWNSDTRRYKSYSSFSLSSSVTQKFISNACNRIKKKKKKSIFSQSKVGHAYLTHFQYKFTCEIPDACYQNCNMRYTLFQHLVYRKKKKNLLKRKFIEKYLYRGNPKRKFENLMVKRKRRDLRFEIRATRKSSCIYIYIQSSKGWKDFRLSKNPVKGIFTNLAKEGSSIRNIVWKENSCNSKIEYIYIYIQKKFERIKRISRLSKNSCRSNTRESSIRGILNLKYSMLQTGRSSEKEVHAPLFRVSSQRFEKQKENHPPRKWQGILLESVGYKTLQKCFSI